MRAGLVGYWIWLVSTASWWALALAPLPGSAPDWLLRTRQVCFGTLPNGLPNGAGWLTLAAPLPMLMALLLLYGAELRAQRQRLILVMIALPLLGLGWVTRRLEGAWRDQTTFSAQQAAETAMPEDYPRSELRLPGFRLLDQHARVVTPEMLRGRPVVMTFAYAHCRTVCPGLVANLKRFRGEAQRVIVTLDPWRDTCGALPDLARQWALPEDTLVLSGSVEMVERLTRALDLPVERNAQTGEIDHPAMVYVLDPEGRVVYNLLNPSAAWIEEAVARACKK